MNKQIFTNILPFIQSTDLTYLSAAYPAAYAFLVKAALRNETVYLRDLRELRGPRHPNDQALAQRLSFIAQAARELETQFPADDADSVGGSFLGEFHERQVVYID